MSEPQLKAPSGRTVLTPLMFGVLCLLPAAALPAGAEPAEAERPAWERKLDPFLRIAALGVPRSSGIFSDSIPGGSAEGLRLVPPFARAERGTTEPILYLKAQIRDDGRTLEALRDLGVEVRGRVGPIASLRAPLSALAGIASLPQIEWLKAAHSYRTQNNVSTSSIFVASRDANATF